MRIEQFLAPWPPYLPAMASALLWALSAQVINLGLARMPQAGRTDSLLTGLLVSQLTGVLTLACLLAVDGAAIPLADMPWQLALAGVFSYPLATGMYYLAGALFGGRADVASQFAKVKPLFSVALAVVVLGEAPDALFSPAAWLVFAGVLVIACAGMGGALPLRAVTWGLLTALAWAIGELCFAAAAVGPASLPATFVALCWGCAVSLPLLMPIAWRRLRSAEAPLRWLWPYALHGVMSFALGYALFFHSIARIGLARTVLINAFWPALAIAIACVLHYLRREPWRVPFPVVLAAVLLLAGSLWQAAGMLH